MKVAFVFKIEMDLNTMVEVEREARSIRDTYFIPQSFSGLVVHTEGDNEDVVYELTEDDQFVQQSDL